MRKQVQSWIRFLFPSRNSSSPPQPLSNVTSPNGGISEEEMSKSAYERAQYYDYHCVNCDRQLLDRPNGSLKAGVERMHSCGKKVICDSCHYDTFYRDWCQHGVSMDEDCPWCRQTSCKHDKNPRNCKYCCPGIGANDATKGAHS